MGKLLSKPVKALGMMLVKHSLIRPAISSGGWHRGCALLDFHDTSQVSTPRILKLVGMIPNCFQNAVKAFGCFQKWGISPQIIHFNRVFHYKLSILGYPYFVETPI